MSDLQIMPTDIIPMVDKAWGVSFGRVRTNTNAIAKIGLLPYNRKLIFHPDMIKHDIK